MKKQLVISVGLIAAFFLIRPCPALAEAFTLSDAALMSLDWERSGYGMVMGSRDVPGLGVEFDIFFPGNEFPESACYYRSTYEGGAGTLSGLDVSMYDSYALQFTLISIDGVGGAGIGDSFVVGSYIGRPGRYKPKVIDFAGSVISETPLGPLGENPGPGLNLEAIDLIGFHVHMWGDGWSPSGAYVTVLVAAAPGAEPIGPALEPIEVALDIKPGSCPNPFNVKSRGLLPVAILGSEELDVSTIDPASLFLGSVPAVRSSYEDVGGPVADANECQCGTAGPDGYLDLTLKFRIADIVAALGEVDHDDILQLHFDGVLDGEVPIHGADCILIRGKHKPLNIADINTDGVVNMADIIMVAENWLQSSIIED